eukprot:RCo049109
MDSDLPIEEWTFVNPEYTQRKVQETTQRILHACRLFERENTMTCDVREVGTIVRSLGLNVTETQLHRIIQEVEEPQPTGWVKFEKLERVLRSILLSGEFQGELLSRDSEDKILAAFAMFDPEGKGYIDADVLQEALLARGEAFTKDEVAEFINAAADPETGVINYEEYAATLATELKL